jgi:hypothetical protein
MKKLKYETPIIVSFDSENVIQPEPAPTTIKYFSLDDETNNPGACIMGSMVGGFGCIMGGSFGVIPKNYEFTGKMVSPLTSDVRKNVTYDNEDIPLVGILDLPEENDVRSGVIFDNLTKEGNIVLPQTSDVRDGVEFDAPTSENLQITDMPIMKGWSLYTHTDMYDIENDYYYSVDILHDVVGPDGHHYVIGTDCEAYDEWCIRWLNGDRPNDGDILLVSFHDPYEEGDFYNIQMLYENVDYYDEPFPDENPFLNNETEILYTNIVSIDGISGYVLDDDYSLVNDKILWISIQQPTEKQTYSVTFTYFSSEPPVLGTLDLPAIADVREGTVFDNETKTGTLEIATIPSEDDVRDGVVFGENDSLTGNLTSPAEADVKLGEQYGANGNEFTGEFIPEYTGVKLETDISTEEIEVDLKLIKKVRT